MQLALADAGLVPGDVQHVNAHGTSTTVGDMAEAAALSALFPGGAPPVTAVKGTTGHMIGGSGAVEAGCKAVIGQRLKLSGMHWSQPGATGILTPREQASGRWEEIWQQPPNRSGAA